MVLGEERKRHGVWPRGENDSAQRPRKKQKLRETAMGAPGGGGRKSGVLILLPSFYYYFYFLFLFLYFFFQDKYGEEEEALKHTQ